MSSSVKNWVEAMRLRTLPVSLAGVLCGIALARAQGEVSPLWAWVCIVFAVLAQIAANFSNEYFDFKAGIDSPERVGPARSVSLGLIKPKAMLAATLITLGLACAVGLLTIIRGGWWLLPVGIVIALGSLAYSTGPYPLSRHCLGEVAVVIFFGIVPVCLTYYLQTLTITVSVLINSIGVGLMGAMVILCNNYRDIQTDRATGKHTLSTRIGTQGSALLYTAMGQFAALLLWLGSGIEFWGFLPIVPMALGFVGGGMLYFEKLTPVQVTKLLAVTSIALLLVTLPSLFL